MVIKDYSFNEPDSSFVPQQKKFTLGVDLDGNPKNQSQTLLIVDDDPDFIGLAKVILRKEGFNVASASDCQTALEKCLEISPDAILLDLMMPDVDGFDIYERIKSMTKVPVIMITANADPQNAVKGLNSGIEDYVSKPFHNAELVARIQSAIRRVNQNQMPVIQEFPGIDLRINFESHEIRYHQKSVRLVPREFTVFSLLAAHPDRPVKYSTIMEKTWGENSAQNKTHLKNIVFSIRRKMEVNPKIPQLIINYWSIGYLLVTKIGPEG
jgi:two-component system KDP operon response regulator KdpE